MENEFSTTYNLFKEAFDGTDFQFPISYEVWRGMPYDMQSAALFVNFYTTIVLAWKRLRTPATVDADCVSEIMVYLQKNVPKIMEYPKRFTEPYIYRVVYNCIYYYTITPYTSTTGVNGYFRNTITNIAVSDDGEFDLFETLCFDEDYYLTIPERDLEYSEMWKIINNLDEKSKLVVYGFMDGRTRIDGVPAKERKKIVENLKELFAQFL